MVEARDVDPDGVGQLWASSPALFRGYWRNPAASAEALVGGFFATGDLGTVTADGLVTVVDRRADLINSGGMNVYPSEVERVLLESGLVRECAVVAATHERWARFPSRLSFPSIRDLSIRSSTSWPRGWPTTSARTGTRFSPNCPATPAAR